jgi:hypothetical protein
MPPLAIFASTSKRPNLEGRAGKVRDGGRDIPGGTDRGCPEEETGGIERGGVDVGGIERGVRGGADSGGVDGTGGTDCGGTEWGSGGGGVDRELLGGSFPDEGAGFGRGGKRGCTGGGTERIGTLPGVPGPGFGRGGTDRGGTPPAGGFGGGSPAKRSNRARLRAAAQ